MIPKSQRRVVSEEEILAQPCPKCHVIENVGCHNNERLPLAHSMHSTELAFHRARIMTAQNAQLAKKFAGILNATDKSMIIYYAFIMQCESVASKSKEMIGKRVSSEDLQKFFVMKAIEELKKDRLLDDAVFQDGPSGIVM